MSGKRLLEYSVRGAEEADLDRILEVESVSFPGPWPRAVFQQELKNRWSRVDIVEDVEGRLIGYLVYWIVHDELHLLNIAIHPDLRRRGLARLLLGYLEGVCQQEGLTYLTLEVRLSNVAAQRLYRSHGFEVIHRRKNYYVDQREDALVMAKALPSTELDDPEGALDKLG